ncbi:MAG TPA: hypothetical protein VJO99_14720 [Burkholderiaceae bacterium]|nr:hypothetical protein [Burkholderiaceae bacterium]
MSAKTRAALLALLLAACSSTPPPPDWQSNSKAAIERAVAAHLTGNDRIEALEFERARSEVARTGRFDLAARMELMRCAARVASLTFEPCRGFEALRDQADAAERRYADYLAGRAIAPQDIALLPPAQQTGAGAGPGAALKEITDPFARLVAIGVRFETNRADPAAIDLAIATASAQGWRRPLLAWLNVQLQRAQSAGAQADVERLRRRIELVAGPPPG